MPDRATVQVMVDGDGSNRDDAYAAAARLAKTVDEVLEANSHTIERVTTTALVVQPRTRWRKGETIRTGWRAYRSSTVEITGIDSVGAVLASLAAAGAAVSGLRWELDGSNPANDEARRRAGQDARRRAELYADALGVQLGRVAWAAEPGLRVPRDHFAGPVAFAAAASPRPGGAMAEETIEVNPEELTVRAAIEVGFEL